MGDSEAKAKEAVESTLLKSKRRCALCFIAGRQGPRIGSVAHIEKTSKGAEENNLIFLCADHHREFDTGRSISARELRTARAKLYDAMRERPDPDVEERPWSVYERRVVDLIRSEMSLKLGDFFALRENELHQGRSGVLHSVDLVVEFTIAALKFIVVFEIKASARPISSGDLLAFSALVNDIGSSKGVFVSRGGFSTAAMMVGRAQGLTLIHLTDKARTLEEAVVSDLGPTA